MLAKIKNKLIDLEVADTPQKAKKGLSGRKSLKKDSGMLFIFDNLNPVIQTREMLFPLDLLFIKRTGEITDIVIAKEKSKDMFEGEGMYVIELNQGFASKNNINKGDKVLFFKQMYTPSIYEIQNKKKPMYKTGGRVKALQSSGKSIMADPRKGRPLPKKEAGGAMSEPVLLHILGMDGKIQKTIPDKSRIVSRKETKKMINLAANAKK